MRLASAIAAPVALIGGWTIAAQLQPASYDPVTDTISALAGYGATDRLVMTGALVIVGVSHAVTASQIPEARTVGRCIYAVGAAATLAVAALPLPVEGTSPAHAMAATVAFGALGAWPLFAYRPDAKAWALRRRASIAAGGVLLGLVGAFAISQQVDHIVGLTERIAAGAQALWPLVVVISLRRSEREPQQGR